MSQDDRHAAEGLAWPKCRFTISRI